jgi:ADP-ribose pyrophosphatase YjhB (NUDIX family)
MHEIQQYIIKQLIHKDVCRYRDIKPKDVEGNLFMYHLRKLIRDGFIEKTATGYKLTRKGLRMVDTLSLKNMQPRIQPKIVTLIACQNERGEWLLYRRTKQPFFGLIGFPYGKIHLGERIQDAANREIEEKTGLTAELRHAGDVYLTVEDDESLLTHMLFHVFHGTQTTGSLKTDSVIGECFWMRASDIRPEELMPGFAEIIELIMTKDKHFFAEYSFLLPVNEVRT